MPAVPLHSVCGPSGIPLAGGVHWALGTVSTLLCGCHSPVGGKVCALAVGVEALRSVSELQLWSVVGGRCGWSSWREPTEHPSSGAACPAVSRAALPVTRCDSSQSTLLALPLARLTAGDAGSLPWCPQSSFSQGHQLRSTEGRLQEHSGCAWTYRGGSSEPDPAQYWHAHIYTAHSYQEQTFPASGEPAAHPDDLQLLSSQRRPW